MDSLIERLRRVQHYRRQWVEPHGEVDVPCDADMADWPGVETALVNPDGPEAADALASLQSDLRIAHEALREARKRFATIMAQEEHRDRCTIPSPERSSRQWYAASDGLATIDRILTQEGK